MVSGAPVFVSFSSSGAKQASTIPELVGDGLKAILFDIDGTLCDSDDLHYIAWNEMLMEVSPGACHARCVRLESFWIFMDC